MPAAAFRTTRTITRSSRPYTSRVAHGALAYNLFTQKPTQELHDFQRWTQMTHPGLAMPSTG